MQRIKSQSICQAQGHILLNQQRPRSKKVSKGQSSDQIGHIADKTKNSIPSITQNSMVSIKTNSKTMSGSMKNLRVGNNQQITAKNSVQNTSRAVNGQNSNISARILKQIVGYSYRGNSKPKSSSKDQNYAQNREDNTIKIDLTEEGQNLFTAMEKEDQPRTTLSNNKNKSKSQEQSSQKQHEGGNSNQKYMNKKKGAAKCQHRIVQQFSPLNLSPSKQKNGLQNETKKYSFFNASTQQLIKISARKITKKPSNPNNNPNSSHMAKEAAQVSKTNYETNKNYSSFNDIQRQFEVNKIDSNNFVKVTSPHHLLSSLDKSGISKVSEVPFQAFCQKENLKNFSNSLLSQCHEVEDNKFLQFQVEGDKMTEHELEEQRQKLVICLQQSNALLQQLPDFKFKQLVPYWKQLITYQTNLTSLSKHISQLNSTLTHHQHISSIKKTQLFELTRDRINRKKEKDYRTRNNKDKYIKQAIQCQQGLKLKLSSKADYQHVILFNQRVILTGRNATDDLYTMFVEMFQGKLGKKFGLVAKKELANLSVYDSRLIQDFIKKIQQLQSCYSKIQSHQPQQNNPQNYCSTDQQQKLQQLVQQIQQATLNLSSLQTTIQQKQKQQQEIEQNITHINDKIVESIKVMNKNVSTEYKMMEGKFYDFQHLLKKKCQNQFQAYRRETLYREDILGRLRRIEERRKSEQASQRSSYHRLSSRKSISFVSTPDTRSPLKLQMKRGEQRCSQSNVFNKSKIKE